MDSHTDSLRRVQRLEIVETGRRRRWSEDEKLRIVLESLQGPRLVSATARRHGISRSLLLIWRRAFEASRSSAAGEPAFVPAVVVGEHAERHLDGFTGVLQADAFAGFNRFYAPTRRPGPLVEAACWAYGRWWWAAPRCQRPLFVAAPDAALRAREATLTRRQSNTRMSRLLSGMPHRLFRSEQILVWERYHRADRSHHAEPLSIPEKHRSIQPLTWTHYVAGR